MEPTIHLTGTAAELHARFTETLSEADITIRVTDTETITAWCVEMGTYFDCMAVVMATGAVVEMQNGAQSMRVISPEFKVARASIAEARKIRETMPHKLKDITAMVIGEGSGLW